MSQAVAGVQPDGFWEDLVSTYANRGDERPWFAEGAIEGTPIVAHVGAEKTCKSWTDMQLVVATVAGGKWLSVFPIRRPGTAIYFDGEYGSDEFVRRIARIARGMGLDPRDVLPHIRYHYSADLTLARTDEVFKTALRLASAEAIALIVLDPYRNHLEGNENDTDVTAKAFRCLRAMRGAAKCPLLFSHHLNKGGNTSGSRAITTMADLIIEGTDAETPTYSTRGRTLRSRIDPIARPFTIELAHEHDHDDSIAATRLVWTPANTDSEAKATLPLPRGLSAFGEKVLTLLLRQKEPRTTNYIAKVVKRSQPDTQKELERLLDAGHVQFFEGGVTFNAKVWDGWRAAQHLLSTPTNTPTSSAQTSGTYEGPTSGGTDRESDEFDAGSHAYVGPLRAPDDGHPYEPEMPGRHSDVGMPTPSNNQGAE